MNDAPSFELGRESMRPCSETEIDDIMSTYDQSGGDENTTFFCGASSRAIRLPAGDEAALELLVGPNEKHKNLD